MAGGKGTRVASVNDAIPKPIYGKPVLQHQIECLKRQGITEITLAIGHLGEQIRSRLKNVKTPIGRDFFAILR